MDGCGLNLTVSALACAIAKDKTTDEISVLAAVFTQLGDALATIAVGNELCAGGSNANGQTVNIA